MIYTYIPANGSGAAIDFSTLTWIGFIIASLIIVFGVVRLMGAGSNSVERDKGIATIFRGAVLVPAVALFIELPHTLFF